jgi:hypothetical protein
MPPMTSSSHTLSASGAAIAALGFEPGCCAFAMCGHVSAAPLKDRDEVSPPHARSQVQHKASSPLE